MGCRVVIGFDAVTGADQKFAILDNDRTDRNLAAAGRPFGNLKGQFHVTVRFFRHAETLPTANRAVKQCAG